MNKLIKKIKVVAANHKRAKAQEGAMLRKFVTRIFASFNWDVLDKKEVQALKGGIEKHTSVLCGVACFVPFQIALCMIVGDILTVLTVASFIALMLGGGWFAISFQNVAEKQIEAGVSDYITKKMFRAFILSFSVLPIGSVFFLVRSLAPETLAWIDSLPVIVKHIVLAGNIPWFLLIWVDVYKACVAYDAADSLLGDGFPTLMRGARANAQNLPMLEQLERIGDILEKMGVPTAKKE